MSRFVLTAQLQLQAPRNVNQVVRQIQRQLNGVNVNLNVQGSRQATRQIAQVNQQVNNLNKGAKSLGKNFGVSVKRFAAFSIANRAVSLFANRLSAAIEESIDFQRELIKIKQVSGATNQALSNLTSTITDLSTSLGTSSKDLLATSRILAQTGLQAAQLEVALSALAKTTLAPTFENIEKTAEGAVAILAQFGQGVGALESQLGSINAVAGQFAVESGDLISAVRRTGGVFKSAGGDLNELLGLFTSVRATTRESAESIATGLRTIFTRIQRPKTIEFLKQYGVELTNLEGKFVGPFEAVRQLSQSLQGLEEGDIRFVQIAEELGGFRQIGKVIPLIQQFETAERARAAAVAGSTSLDKDAQTAQEALAVQIQKTRENFLALIRSISETTSFQVLVKTTLGLADALIKVADALKPIIPLLGAFAGFKIAKGLGSFAGGLRGAFTTRNAGGPIGFATGGVVPGTGNRDTVPAMLTPGEFVIRKSSVNKIGAGTLAAMNNNRYADGGIVRLQGDSQSNPIIGQIAPRGKAGVSTDGSYKATLGELGIKPRKGQNSNTIATVKANVDKNILAPKDVGFEDVVSEALSKIQPIIDSAAQLAFGSKTKSKVSQDKNAKDSISGFLYESFASSLAGKATGDKNPFDFTGKKRSKQISKYAEADPIAELLDAKNEFVTPGKIIKKAVDYKKGVGKSDSRIKFRRASKFFGGLIQKFALGGLATKNKVGFAILDPDQGGADLDASVTRAQIRGAVKGTDAQKKALDKELSWPSKNYKVARQGLPEKTSQKFYDTIAQEATMGVEYAASSLSQQLGQGAISMPKDAKQTMVDVIKKSGAQMGRLFEDVLNVIDNKGAFKPAPIGAPWDFKNGLTGGLASTYNKMPSSFVDARTSYGRSGVSAAQGKIIDEIAQEYEKSSTYKNATKTGRKETDKQRAARIAREEKGRARLAKMQEKVGFAKGGAASDTVPALLTPGEFVINAKAASKIGKANLDRMNKKGVAGFAAGGSVGKVQRFNTGGASQAGSARGGVDAAALAFLLPTVIDSMIPTVEKTDDAISQLGTRSFDTRDALSSLITNIGIASVAASTFGIRLKDLPKLLGRGKGSLGEKLSGRIGRGTQATKDRLRNSSFARGRRNADLANTFGAKTNLPKGLLGRLGGKTAGRGLIGRATGAIGRVGLGAVGGVGGAAASIAAFAGPIAAVTGGLLALNSVLKAGLGFQKKYNNAVKLGNVERAKELAVLKEVPALVGVFGESVSAGFINIKSAFGGDTLNSIRLNAEAQALAGKATKDFESNAKAAAEALASIKSGSKTAQEVFAEGDIQKNTLNTIAASNAEIAAADASLENKSRDGILTGRNILTVGGLFGETSREKNKRIDQESGDRRKKAQESLSKAISDLSPSLRHLNQEIAYAGGSFNDTLQATFGDNFEEVFKNLSPDDARKLGEAFINQQKAIIQNLKATEALNTGLSTLDGNIKGLSATLSSSISRLKGDFDQFSGAINNLKAVSDGAIIAPEKFQESLNSIEKALGEVGVDNEIINRTTGQLKEFNTVVGGLDQALLLVKEEALATGKGLNDADLKNTLVDNLTKSLGDDSALKDLLKNTDFVDDVKLTGVISDDVSAISKALREKFNTVLPTEQLENLNNAFKQLAEISTIVYQREKIYAEARINSIQQEEKAANILDEFGVKSLTVGRRLELLGKKAEVNIGTTSLDPKDLQKSIRDSSKKINDAQDKLQSGDGPKDAREREELNRTIEEERAKIESIISITDQRIDIERQALSVAKEKLKLDKEAVNNLLSGNIEDFLKNQEAAAARRAITSGNQAAVGMFSPRALGEAFQSLSDQERRDAAQSGIDIGLSPSQMRIATDTTPEMEAARSNAEDALETQRIARQEQENLAEQDLSRAKAAESDADAALLEAQKELKDSTQKLVEVNERLILKIDEQERSLIANQDEVNKLIGQVGARFATSSEKTRLNQEQIRTGNFQENLTGESSVISKNIRERGEAAGGTILPARTINDPDGGTISDRGSVIGAFLKAFFTAGYATDTSGLFSKGGTVYASKGMFVPRGTDTVPAMLTPGEFVVNRKAVNTGNNRQILERMNGGSSQQNGVYYNNGGEVAPSVDTTALKAIATSLSSSFSKFNDTVNRLINFKFEMTIAPTRVDVVINTPQAMEQMSSQAKEQLLTAVVNEISINQLGKLRRNRNA